jgi:hypothetical protein
VAVEAAGNEDEDEDGAGPAPDFAGPAASAMGAAIRHLGPEEVLRVLPLNLIEVCLT